MHINVSRIVLEGKVGKQDTQSSSSSSSHTYTLWYIYKIYILVSVYGLETTSTLVVVGHRIWCPIGHDSNMKWRSNSIVWCLSTPNVNANANEWMDDEHRCKQTNKQINKWAINTNNKQNNWIENTGRLIEDSITFYKQNNWRHMSQHLFFLLSFKWIALIVMDGRYGTCHHRRRWAKKRERERERWTQFGEQMPKTVLEFCSKKI